MANGNKSGDGVLSKINVSTLTDAYKAIEVLMRKRFAYKEVGEFNIRHSDDGRLITIIGPLELGKTTTLSTKEKEKYSIFIVRDNLDGK